MNKILSKLGIGALVLGSIAGCDNKFTADGMFRGHYAEASSLSGRVLIIYPGTKPNIDGVYLSAVDKGSGRFDVISLEGVPKGDDLEKLADLKTLEKAYGEIMSRK